MMDPKGIKVSFPNSAKLRKAFMAMTNFVIERGWCGACYATVSVLFAVAKRLGIDSVPCIGEAKIGPAIFDHSWLEIDGKVYDVAIAVPLQNGMGSGPVFAGIDITTGFLSNVEYGIRGRGLWDNAKAIQDQDMYDYMANCPEPDLLDLTKIICDSLKVPVSDAWLKENLGNEKRKFVARKPVNI